jgi:CHAT domain-containing protein/tetratricopeptide (TPR) repeat protein
MSLSVVLLAAGDSAGALRCCTQAARQLEGLDAARAEAQRGLVLGRLGRANEALASFARALPVLRAHHDTTWVARVLNNRALVRTYSGDLAHAQRDLEDALDIYREDERLLRAQVEHNLGFVAARRGDVPGALARFDAATAGYVAEGVARSVLYGDRCEVLLAAGLVAEARSTAAAAVEELAAQEAGADLSEAELMLAHACLRDGDPQEADRLAASARSAFRDQRRPVWTALARHAGVQARWLAGERSPHLAAEARAAARSLAEAGWPIAALDARLVAARIALESAGRAGIADTAWLGRARRRAPLELRARAWHLEALRRLSSGDRRGASAASRAGLRSLDRQRERLGSIELRAHSSSHARELAALGLELAIESRRAPRVLDWSERMRAGALALDPVRPPDDPRLAEWLAQLRAAAAAVDAETRAGRDAVRERRRQASLERCIVARTRQQRGVNGDRAERGRTRLDELAGALGDRALVELVAAGDRMHAVVMADHRLALRQLGPAAPIDREHELLGFALRQLVDRRRHALATDLPRENIAHGAARLDELLLRPLERLVGDRELVVSPTGALHAVPWALLPSCRGRPVALAPSAALWVAATSRARASWSAGSVVLVAGPRLEHAELEIEALGRLYPGATSLTGARASCDAVRRALGSAACAHIAAHGRFRSDNPLFSRIELADGGVTVYDLERLERAPGQIVLSACDSALSDTTHGHDLMGLAGALLRLGTQTLIGSVGRVDDGTTRRLMERLHGHLSRDRAPAEALADAIVATAAETDDPGAAAFVCLGAG